MRVWEATNILDKKLDNIEGMEEELKGLYEKIDQIEDRKEIMKTIEEI